MGPEQQIGELTKEQIRQVFELCDSDNDGIILKEDFVSMIYGMGPEVPEELTGLIASLNRENYTLEEFENFILRNNNELSSHVDNKSSSTDTLASPVGAPPPPLTKDNRNTGRKSEEARSNFRKQASRRSSILYILENEKSLQEKRNQRQHTISTVTNERIPNESSSITQFTENRALRQQVSELTELARRLEEDLKKDREEIKRNRELELQNSRTHAEIMKEFENYKTEMKEILRTEFQESRKETNTLQKRLEILENMNNKHTGGYLFSSALLFLLLFIVAMIIARSFNNMPILSFSTDK